MTTNSKKKKIKEKKTKCSDCPLWEEIEAMKTRMNIHQSQLIIREKNVRDAEELIKLGKTR